MMSTFPIKIAPNSMLRDIKSFRQRCLFSIFSMIMRSNIPNLLISKFESCPSFKRCIVHIFSICSQKQMIWSNAWRIVATMANKLSFWNRPIVQFERKSISQHGLSWVSCLNAAISFPVFRSLPNPTMRGFIDVFPKSNFGWNHLKECIGFPSQLSPATSTASRSLLDRFIAIRTMVRSHLTIITQVEGVCNG